MKHTTMALAGALLCAFATPAASADGWYLGLGAGWSQLADGDYSAPALGLTGDASFGSAVRGSVSGGYKWATGIRAELEFGYAKYDFESATGNGAPLPGTGGDIALATFLANVAYDIPIGQSFSFTAGGGIGAGSVRADYSESILMVTNKGTDTSFAWQLIAGLIWSVGPQFDLQLDYRYVRGSGTTHDLTFQGAPAGNIDYEDAMAHNVMLTARWFP
jgi:opacity protein-like surface antigen